MLALIPDFGFSPTAEQKAIYQQFHRGDHPPMKVVACAGSGKTATAKYLAFSTHRKGCYLTFGKRNADEARPKFPTSMLVKNTHALAHKEMRVRETWGHKLNTGKNKWPLWRVVQEFSVQDAFGISASHIAYSAIVGLRRYLYSAEDTITLQQTYDRSKGDRYFEGMALASFRLFNPIATEKQKNHFIEKELDRHTKELKNQYQRIVYQLANTLLNAQIDPQHPYPIEHDTYLKLWQLREPKIPDIDYLILDEAQDTNPCVFDIVKNQSCQIILLGDPAQGIFGFRNAVDVMDEFDAETYDLSQSFRFGQKEADVANAILKIAYDDRTPIKGNPLLSTTIGPIRSGAYTLIARTNAGLFSEAIELAKTRKKIHVVGSLKEPIERARSTYFLSKDRLENVRHPDIKAYDDWDSLVEESKYDLELARYVKLVNEQGADVLALCDQLETKGEVSEKQADVVLVTAHKAKGLEYTQVKLANDYSRLKIEADINHQLTINGPREEVNVLYVAATRAERRMELNDVAQIAYSRR